MISTENGSVLGYDYRKTGEPLFGTKAHIKACTSVMMSSHVKGMMATASLDGHVKVWDTQTIEDGAPRMIADKPMKAGKLNCGAFYQDSAWTLACGDSKGELAIWDTSSTDPIAAYFADRVVVL